MSKTLFVVLLPVMLGTVAMAVNNVVKRSVMKNGTISTLQCLILYYAAATTVFGTMYVFL